MLSKNRIKFIRSLQQKKFREEHAKFIVEGEKAVFELMDQHPDWIDSLYLTDHFEWPARYTGAAPEIITNKELEQISGLKTPNKALAVCNMRLDEPPESRFALVLDGVQDPGNMGTLIRLADWYGIEMIWCSPDTVDVYNPKVVQASMASLFRVRVAYKRLEPLLSAYQGPVYGALLQGENVYQKELKPEGLLLLGNEGKGISEALIPQIKTALHIPRLGKAESLNVSMAGAILLSEFFRNEAK